MIHKGFETIATDFDGTLCTDKWPDIGEPNQQLINHFIEERADGRIKLILWSCRCGEMLNDAVDWCHDHGLEFDAVNENIPETVIKFGSESRKISADEYWDDRARRIICPEIPTYIHDLIIDIGLDDQSARVFIDEYRKQIGSGQED